MKHDLPPHCCPTEDGETCCVGVLLGTCRRCGRAGVAPHEECSAPPDPPWTWRQWRENWAARGRTRAP